MVKSYSGLIQQPQHLDKTNEDERPFPVHLMIVLISNNNSFKLFFIDSNRHRENRKLFDKRHQHRLYLQYSNLGYAPLNKRICHLLQYYKNIQDSQRIEGTSRIKGLQFHVFPGQRAPRKVDHFVYLCAREVLIDNINTITKAKLHKGMLPGGINPIWNYLFYPQQYQPFSNPIQPNYFGNNIPDTYPPLPAAQTPRPFTYTAPTQIQSNPPAETYSGGARRRDEGRVYEMKKQKKVFKKDKGCPVEGCGRKYSSRIALRAHIRRQHPRWAEETSDYEP